MHADEFLRLYASGDKSFNQATLSEAKPVRTQLDVTKPAGTKLGGSAMPDAALLLLPLGCIMVWAILVLRLSDVWKVARDRVVSFKDCDQVPCRNCQFFTNNPYLQCAVHPSIALTKQAINCSDYWPQDGRC